MYIERGVVGKYVAWRVATVKRRGGTGVAWGSCSMGDSGRRPVVRGCSSALGWAFRPCGSAGVAFLASSLPWGLPRGLLIAHDRSVYFQAVSCGEACVREPVSYVALGVVVRSCCCGVEWCGVTMWYYIGLVSGLHIRLR